MNLIVAHSLISCCFITLTTLSSVFAQDGSGEIVIEESYYIVSPENQERFLQVYRDKFSPFWKEMNRIGVIDGDLRIYTQRIHTLNPRWTYKTVLRFKNYSAIDKWLEERDNVFNKLFPGEGGYEKVRKELSLITEDHWDEFIREIPLKK